MIEMTAYEQFMDSLALAPVPWTLVLLGVSAALVYGVHYLVRTLNAGRFAWERRLRERLGVAPDKAIGELRWILLSLHLLWWPLVAYLLLRIWGLHDEGRDFRVAVFSKGFTLGSYTIVPGKLLFGILLFFALFTFTRWLKRKIEYDWLPKTSIEPGTRVTVATIFGYITFVIAALIGLSSAGIDLTKLAIVAGALSVGIGFGLQNIVNNFVSGLILLFERPIRAGDYIFVGQTQGFVRRMQIRATQIETSDREIVIVPNSEFLSTHLKRLNLRDRHANVSVAIGAAYGSDTSLVRQTLLDVANEHPQLIKAGQERGVGGPSVVFVNFGPSSLDFELRGQIADSSKRGTVASDLRFAIDAAFRKAGIEMPFPQQDVWVRSLPEAATPSAAAAKGAQPD
jgi:potassium efflux system protein